MFITYYNPDTDDLYQSEATVEIANKERDRVLWAPWVQKVSEDRELSLPLRPLPDIALK